ncbi:MAG: hypothetical protein ACPGYV_04930 [Phycisphaeraceae bacterium]
MSLSIPRASIVALCVVAGLTVGCLNPGQTIRVRGEVVNTQGERVTDAQLAGSGFIRGGLILAPGEIENPNPRNQDREVGVEHHGDGTFTATTHWAGAMTLWVEGYKLRRVDELGTVFLVPTIVFEESQDDVRLEVVPHD